MSGEQARHEGAIVADRDDPYRQLAQRIRQIARSEARTHVPATIRMKVRHIEPLLLDEINGDLVLEEGDEDLEIDERLLPGLEVTTTCPAGTGTGHRNHGTLPEVGDTVIVSQAPDGDYVAHKLVKRGDHNDEDEDGEE